MASSRNDKRGAWKNTPGLKDRVVAYCGEHGPKAGNLAIVQLVSREFGLEVSPCQVAGVVHRWGIVRGHPPRGSQPSQRAERDRDRALRQVDRLKVVDTRAEHKRGLEREREAKARTRRNSERNSHSREDMHQRLEAGPDPDLTVTSDAARAHDIAMARPMITRHPAHRQHHSTVPKVTLAALPTVKPASPFSNLVYRAPQAEQFPFPTSFGRSGMCFWPLGEPGTPQFRYCDASHSNSGPYCDEHHKIAYLRVRDRREDAPDPLPRFMAGWR